MSIKKVMYSINGKDNPLYSRYLGGNSTLKNDMTFYIRHVTCKCVVTETTPYANISTVM